jgi:hypothetical protein
VNGLPLTASVQAFFTDEHYNKIDSLTGNDRVLIREAPVDISTHLPVPGMFGIKDTTFIMNSQRMARFETVRKVLIIAVLHSSDGGKVDVKIKADQKLDVTFSARAKLKKAVPGNN